MGYILEQRLRPAALDADAGRDRGRGARRAMGGRPRRSGAGARRRGPDRQDRRHRAGALRPFVLEPATRARPELERDARPPRHGQMRAQIHAGRESRAPLPRRAGPRQRAHRLADRGRLSRRRAACRRMVRAAHGIFAAFAPTGWSRRTYLEEKYPERREALRRNGARRWIWRAIAGRALRYDRWRPTRISLRPKAPCQACGACCAYSRNWPRFTTEDDAALDLIPERFVNDGCRACAATATAAAR